MGRRRCGGKRDGDCVRDSCEGSAQRGCEEVKKPYPGSLTRDMSKTRFTPDRDVDPDCVQIRYVLASSLCAKSHPDTVPYDQWFVTHLDDKSKVKHVKLWCLSKCNLVQSPGPHSQRSVSPIVFASSVRPRSSIDSLDDGYSEDDEFSDQDVPPHHPASSKHAIYPHRDTKPGSSSQPASSPLVDQYTLLSFSTGTILEDEFALSWYNLRPYELLEMHPVGILAPLQRDVLTDYIQPYFQARVRVLRAVWNHKSGRFEAPGIDPQRERKATDKLTSKLDTRAPKSATPQSEKKRKTKVDWKARWVVIHQGTLFLCKEHVVHRPPSVLYSIR